VFIATISFEYPVSAMLEHGFKWEMWPPGVIRPDVWIGWIEGGQIQQLSAAYSEMAHRSSSAFTNGGWTRAVVVGLFPLAFVLAWPGRKSSPLRHFSNQFGSARFASNSERAAMTKGLELGIDPTTGRPVRIQVEGTLLSVAPPRKGKTSGLIIPNLAYPERTAWSGPAVVIDPKGDVYAAVAERRRKLGRRVIRVDPLGSGADQDTWNPMQHIDVSDVLYLQHAARSILPQTDLKDANDDYFRGRATTLIVGAMLIAVHQKKPSVVEVQRLINNKEEFISHLKRLTRERDEPAAEAATQLLLSDQKTLDPIYSTAQRAFEWLSDTRMRAVVQKSTFDMSEIAEGTADLFIVLPTEFSEILAPFTRWMLSNLFMTIRNRKGDNRQRIVVFLDEADAVGRFDAIRNAAAELPGYGLSLWSFWQDRSQIVEKYGDNGAAMLVRSAEIVTVSNLSAADGTESEYWSNALGSYTGVVESNQSGEGKKTASSSKAPQAVRLMTKEDLTTMPENQMVVIANSKRAARHPMILRKTVAHEDPRFKPFVADLKPVGTSR
jgi:type IV secretion system protein VirD4